MINYTKYSTVFFESVYIFMAVFFFIQYSIIRKREHLNYAIYLLFLAIYYLLAIPEIFFNVSTNDLAKIEAFKLFKRPAQFITSIFYTFFVIYYLGLKAKSKFLFRFFSGLNILYFIVAVCCFLLNYFRIPYDKVYYIFSLLLFPLQFYVLLALFKHKVPYSKYIIWGSIVTIVSSAFTLILSIYLNNAGGQSIYGNAISYLPVQAGIVIDIFLFSIALQKKIADNEKSLINAAYQRQQAVLLERERIIADLHDDVGGGLSSIRMMSDLMAQQNEAGSSATVSSFANKISMTAKEIAQRMHTIIWSLNAENDTLQNFAEYVRQYGISFFENSPVKFNCNSLSALPTEIQLNGVQRKNLFLLMKEAFHNILKHSNADKATVNMEMQDHTLMIDVTDNGKGLNSENKFGNGLKNMKKRMDEIGGQVNFSSHNGAIIKVTVPLP